MRFRYLFLIIGVLFLVFSCVNDDESDLSSSSQLSGVSNEALSPQAKAFLAQSRAWLQGQDSSVQKGIERLGSLDWERVAYSPATENSPEMLSVALTSEGQDQRLVTFTGEKGGIRSDLYAVEPRENGMESRSLLDFSGDVYKFDARGRFEDGYRLGNGKETAELRLERGKDLMASIFLDPLEDDGAGGGGKGGKWESLPPVTVYPRPSRPRPSFPSRTPIPPRINPYPGDRGRGGGGSSSSGNAVAIALNEVLQQDPIKLVNCKEIKNWQKTMQFKPGSDIIDKLKNLPTRLLGPKWDVQKIQNASGTVVNLDYFPIKVDRLPVVSGRRLSAPEFLSHIRKNINSFIDKETGVKFRLIDKVEPGENKFKGQTELWNSDNPKGAIISLRIPVTDSVPIINKPIRNDGSVIVSNVDTHRNSWTFTTIRNWVDGDHPVSGNRQFDYNQNADGSYTFYTRAADRLESSSAQALIDFSNYAADKLNNVSFGS